jgi:hypothetical protein
VLQMRIAGLSWNRVRMWVRAHSFPSLINNGMQPPVNIWSLIGSPKYVFWQHLLFVIAVYINIAKSYFYETKPEDKFTCMYQSHILFLFERTSFTFSKQRLECLIYITKKIPLPFTRSLSQRFISWFKQN